MRIVSYRSKRLRREVSDDKSGWIISYADFMTLLFALFVLLYAIASLYISKYKNIIQSLDNAFRGGDNSTKSNLSSQNSGNANIKKKIKQHIKDLNKQEKTYEALKYELKQYQGNFFKIRAYNDWYEIEMKSNQLFQSGQAILTPSAMKKIKELAVPFSQLTGLIAIEGHTDSKSISTLMFPSNWALSAARAASVAQALEVAGISKRQISVVGFGSQYPIASNRTSIGRAKNRIVKIIVPKTASSLRLLNPMLSKLIIEDPYSKYTNFRTIKTMKEVKNPLRRYWFYASDRGDPNSG